MRGGKREGAGRPKGSTKKPQFGDFVTEEEVQSLVQEAKEQARAGKTDMLRFVLEQIFGRAPQNIDLTSQGEPLPLLGGLSNGDSNKSNEKATETEQEA